MQCITFYRVAIHDKCFVYFSVRMNGVFACCKSTQNLNRYLWAQLFWTSMRMAQSSGKMITMAWFIKRMRLVVSLQYTTFLRRICKHFIFMHFFAQTEHKNMCGVMCFCLQVLSSKLLNDFESNLTLETH
jgi:hypothetical protein